jgi:hypothetical protein
VILIRDVFPLRFGKAREALAAWEESEDYLRKSGHLPESPRMLTHLVGPYYTLVLEMTAQSLAHYEEESRKAMADPQWRTLYQRFTPFAESGYREIFTIVQ